MWADGSCSGKRPEVERVCPLPFTLSESTLCLSCEVAARGEALFQVSKFLEFLPGVLRILHQRSINQISDLPSLVDVKSLEAFASIIPCIGDMQRYNLRILLDYKLIFIPIAGYFCYGCPIRCSCMVAMIDTADSVQIHADVVTSTKGNEN